VRTPPSFVNSSYRIFLPTSLLGGGSTFISDGHQSFLAYGGRVGRLEGSAVQTFDATPGEVAGLGYERRIGLWSLGGQGVAVQGVPEVHDHEAATLAVEYGSNGDLVHHKAQIVADSDSHLGAWFDGDVSTGRMRQRFGLYNLDPGLEWADSPLQDDQRGAYWRGDFRTLRYTLSGGLDALQTNLRDDPERSALRSGTAYGTASLRIDRNLNIGGGLTYQVSRTRFGGAPRSDVISGNAYASWTGGFGVSRFDVTSYHGNATDTPDTRVDNYSWSQEWPTLGAMHTSSTLTYSREDNAGVRTDRSSVGFSGSGALYNGLTWDASVVYGRIQTDTGNEHDFNVSATATWPFAAHWVGTAQVSVTTFDVLPALPGLDTAPATQHDKRLLLGVRYEAASGTPYQALGMRGGAGSGRIAGMVFFDENGDGVRQATERGAANITVYLDGRFPVTTDAQGRFYYSVVTPGNHALRILSESLPLPWSIDEDHPRGADVPLRGEIAVDIPLIKIRP